MRDQKKTRLSDEQLRFYKKEGYLLPDIQLFDPADFQELKSIFEEHLANKGAKKSDELDTPHFRDNRLFKFLLHPNTLDVVESILGPNIGLFSSHFISKEPLTGRRTPWHEDSAYWQGKFDRLDKIVTIWFAIDNAFYENGCMGVIPGTHHNCFSKYTSVGNNDAATFETEIKYVDEKKVVWFELDAGTFSLHDARIIHGAHANTSTQRRCGYTMRYFALDMRFNETAAPDHKIYYCRGKNLADNALSYHIK